MTRRVTPPIDLAVVTHSKRQAPRHTDTYLALHLHFRLCRRALPPGQATENPARGRVRCVDEEGIRGTMISLCFESTHSRSSIDGPLRTQRLPPHDAAPSCLALLLVARLALRPGRRVLVDALVCVIWSGSIRSEADLATHSTTCTIHPIRSDPTNKTTLSHLATTVRARRSASTARSIKNSRSPKGCQEEKGGT